MNYIFSAHAFGDSLITLSLLERLGPDSPPYRVFGTSVTHRVSELMQRALPVIELLNGEAALYTVKAQGIRRALQDFYRLRRGLRRHLGPGDVVAFEFPDKRSLPLVPRGCVARFARKSDSVYRDRYELIRDVIADPGSWLPSARPVSGVRNVVINPCARHPSRWIPIEAIETFLAIASRREWLTTLLDPCARFWQYRERVANYVAQPALPDAASCLRGADLYIGPDSFFLHLAYYYGVPHFGFFLPHHLIYLTPGMREQGGFITFEQSRDAAQLERALLKFVGDA